MNHLKNFDLFISYVFNFCFKNNILLWVLNVGVRIEHMYYKSSPTRIEMGPLDPKNKNYTVF